jgi:hypothetical protein
MVSPHTAFNLQRPANDLLAALLSLLLPPPPPPRRVSQSQPRCDPSRCFWRRLRHTEFFLPFRPNGQCAFVLHHRLIPPPPPQNPSLPPAHRPPHLTCCRSPWWRDLLPLSPSQTRRSVCFARKAHHLSPQHLAESPGPNFRRRGAVCVRRQQSIPRPLAMHCSLHPACICKWRVSFSSSFTHLLHLPRHPRHSSPISSAAPISCLQSLLPNSTRTHSAHHPDFVTFFQLLWRPGHRQLRGESQQGHFQLKTHAARGFIDDGIMRAIGAAPCRLSPCLNVEGIMRANRVSSCNKQRELTTIRYIKRNVAAESLTSAPSAAAPLAFSPAS